MKARKDPVPQRPFGVRFDWGAEAASRIAEPPGALVVVDVLFFGTTVSVAVEAGSAVVPSPADDDVARRLAAGLGGIVAARHVEASARHPWTVFPASLRATAPPARLVLPSRNGSAIVAAASASPAGPVAVACLRNARAVGEWACRRHGTPDRPVAVVAAGERWPDGSLRPALEDLVCAGAVIDAVARCGRGPLSPEAEAARAVFAATGSIDETVRACTSGVEVAAAGLGADLDIALEVGASRVVPVLRDGALRAAGRQVAPSEARDRHRPGGGDHAP